MKQERTQKVKNYSKNVKDLYMPGGVRGSRGGGLTDTDTPSAAEERKLFIGQDSGENNVQKQIKTRLRSGAPTHDGDNTNYGAENHLAD